MGEKEEDGDSLWGEKRKKMTVKRHVTVTRPVDRLF
jgi:hypothetical protein